MATRKSAASTKVEKVMHERKAGTLRSSSGKKVTSRKQAIAIGLSEARRAGADVPENPNKPAARKSAKKTSARKTGTRKTAARKTSARKTSARKTTSRKTASTKASGNRTGRGR